jgi:uncharacterized protein (DUF924 family)
MACSGDVIEFWFTESGPEKWWVKDPAFDRLIERRFGRIHRQAIDCELFAWRESALGRLAEILVIDQFSRNIYRDQPQSFAFDSLALALAQEAIRQDVQRELKGAQRAFLYMPYMHSESAEIHEIAAVLFSDPEVEGNRDFELRHKAIIDRFGRYPHRNEILNRVPTPEELDFLGEPGSSF